MSVKKAAEKSQAAGEAPRWLIATSLIVVTAVLFYFGRNAIAGSAADPGPPKKVYPGMYDLRSEAAKMRAAKEGSAVHAAPR